MLVALSGGRPLIAKRDSLVRARKAAGYTQEGLASALHIDRSTINRWEAGKYAPQPYLWPKLAQLLGVSREQLELLLADGAATLDRAESQAVAFDPMRRRNFVKWGGAAAAAATVGAGDAIGMADVRRLQHAVARLHSLDQQYGGETLWQAASAHADEGLNLLEQGSYTEGVGQLLLQVTGQLHICAGWLAFDAGHHDVARNSYTTALAVSRQASDPQVEMRALANLAMQSNALSRPREALRFATGAERAAAGPAAPTWLGVFPQLRMAVASALTKNATDADQAITRARRVLERGSRTTGEGWASFLSPLEIDAVEATCALDLRRPSRAEQLFERSMAGYAAQHARNLALYRVRLAQARLGTGAVDGAVEAALMALDDLSGGLTSWRVESEFSIVARRLASYPDVQHVDEFLVRYQALNN